MTFSRYAPVVVCLIQKTELVGLFESWTVLSVVDSSEKAIWTRAHAETYLTSGGGRNSASALCDAPFRVVMYRKHR